VIVTPDERRQMTAPYTDISIRGNDPGAPRRRARASAVGVGVALVVAAGAYVTTHGSGRAVPVARPTPASSEPVASSERTMRELNHTIRALYGPRPRGEASARPGR
jgi:hypothetical protein